MSLTTIHHLRCRRGFSMIELVIVVVIIGIVASIAVPRMSQAAARAKANALQGNIRILNGAAEMYAVEHLGQTPAHEGGAVVPMGSALVRRLTQRTDMEGSISSGNKIFGPYLKSMPTNPVNGLRTVRVDGAIPRSGVYGWRFDSATNTFFADHTPAQVDAWLSASPSGTSAAIADGPDAVDAGK